MKSPSTGPARPLVPHPKGLGKALALTASLAALLAGAAFAQAPLTLADAIATVRKSSDETRLIAEKSAKLDAMKSELWASALPHLSAYASVGRGATPFNPSVGTSFGQALAPLFANLPQHVKDSLNAAGNGGISFNTAATTYAYGLQLNQTLFSPALGQSIATAGKQIKAQNAANDRSMQELEMQTLDAFYAVIMAEARVRLLDASLERQGKTAAFLDANFKRGAGARSQLLLTKAALKGLEPERIRASRDADAARMNLNRLLGRPVDEPLTLDTASALAGTDADARPTDRAIEARPDIQAISLQKETLKGYARVYRMQYLPSLGLQGKWGILAYKPNEQLTDFDNNLDWQVGLGLTWTLFDGLGNRAKARQYDSDVRSLAANERQARAFARIEIESAHREAEASDTALAAAQQARDASAEALELISQDFRAGSGNVTDLLSAEEGLRSAESGLLAARYQKARAKAALRVAMGMNLTEGETK